MLTFLFWNLKRSRPEILGDLVRRHNVDILMLAECPTRPALVLESLNRGAPQFFYVRSECPKIEIYTRFSEQYLLPQDKQPDFTIRRLELPDRPKILLCVVHFPSKLRQHPVDQTGYTFSFGRKLADAEEAVAHGRTILV